ncbi:MAG: acyl-ACP--UDP-N-acetylglucosamine O-acyltransferase [Ignavibacteriaceae bacterium]
MTNIHSTAIVSPKAKLGSNIEIGPYSIIEDDVEIGNDCKIGPHACIYNGARISDRVKIFQAASISNLPQDLKFNNEKSFLFIDSDTTIREYATLHKGTSDGGSTKVGKNCLIMTYAHVAHDCQVGDSSILSNGVQVAGHCVIQENVVIGGLTGVHQFSKVGKYSMIGACNKIAADIPPYVLASGYPIRFEGLNIIGLRRKGFSNDDILLIKDIYKILYTSGLTFTKAKEKISEDFKENIYAKEILDFIKKSERGIIRK